VPPRATPKVLPRLREKTWVLVAIPTSLGSCFAWTAKRGVGKRRPAPIAATQRGPYRSALLLLGCIVSLKGVSDDGKARWRKTYVQPKADSEKDPADNDEVFEFLGVLDSETGNDCGRCDKCTHSHCFEGGMEEFMLHGAQKLWIVS